MRKIKFILKKNIVKKFIFIIFIFFLIFDSQKLNANLNKNTIKNIFSDRSHGQQIYINLSESILDLKYQNFEDFIKIDPFVQIKCRFVNSKNISCNILNPEEIIPEKFYSIKIYNSEKFKNDQEKNPIIEKKIIIKNLKFFDASIQELQNKNTPIIKIVFDDFVLKNEIIQKIKLIKKSNKKFFLLRDVENFDKYLNDDEKKQNQELFDRKFNNKNLSELQKNNLKKIYKKIIFLKPISLLEENQEFDLFFEEDEKELEIESKQRNEMHNLLNIVFEEGDENSPQNQIQKKPIFSFKTFAKNPKFLGIQCLNYKYNLIILEKNKKYNFDNQEFQCKPQSFINLLFSSSFLDSNILNNIDFSWELDRKKNIENNKKYPAFQNFDNPYKISIESPEAGKKYSFSYNEKKKNFKFQEILKNKINKKNEITDIFGDKFDDKFDFEFMIQDREPEFFNDKFLHIFNLSKFDNENIFYKTTNIKNYIFQYDFIKSNFIKKNEIYEKNLENLEKNKKHQVQLFDKEIFENQTGILIGDISANPMENKIYNSIKEKILIQNTSFDLITKKYKNNLIIFPFDLKNNQNIKNAEISLKEINDLDFFEKNFEKMEKIISGQTDDEGIFTIKNLNLNFYEKTYLIEIKKNSEIAWSFLKFPFEEIFEQNIDFKNYHTNDFYQQQKFDNIGFFAFPDSFVKKTEENLFYKIYLKNLQKDFDLENFIKNFEFNLYLKNQFSGKKFLLKKNLEFDVRFFIFSDVFKIPNFFSLGKYFFEIEILKKNNHKEIFFVDLFEIEVQNFEELDFKIEFDLNKKKILFDEQFKIFAKTEFYSGAKKTNSKIRIAIDAQEKNFLENEKFSKFIFENQSNFSKKNFNTKAKRIFFLESKMNENSEFQKNIQIKEYLFPYGEIQIQTTILDENQKNISKRKNIEYFGSEIFVGIQAENFENKNFSKNLNQIFSLLAIDYKKNPINDLEIYSLIEKQDEKNEWNRINKKISKTNQNGVCQINFDLKESGKYRIASFAKNNLEKQIASFEFFIEEQKEISNLNKFQKIENKTLNQKINELEILNQEDQIEHFEKKIKFQIKNPFFKNSQNTKVLIFAENASKQIFMQKIFKSEIEHIEIPIEKEFLGGFDLKIIAFDKIDKNNVFKFLSKKILFDDWLEKKFNSLKIFIDKENYSPNELVEIKFLENTSQLNEGGDQIENLECSLLAMNQFIFDIQPQNKKIENFKLSKQLEKRQSIYLKNLFHLFAQNTNNTNSNFPNSLRSNQPINSENIFQNKESDFYKFFEKNINIENNIIHFEKTFQIKLNQNENKNEKILVSYKIPENFVGEIKNIMICNIPNSNHFFTKEINLKSFKNLEINFHNKEKILSPGEKINLDFSVINNQINNEKNKKIIIMAKIQKNSFLKNLLEFSFFEENISKKKEEKNISDSFEKEFEMQNQEKKNLSISIELKELIQFHNENENFELELFLYEKNLKNENILVDSKKINFLVKFPYFKKTILEEDIIENDKELEKKIKFSNNLNGSKSKISISLSKTILNNLEKIFMIAEKYDENFFRSCLAKIFALEVYDFFVQKENFSKNKIFENFEWIDYEKNLNNLLLKLKKYQNDKIYFKEILSNDNFKKNIFLASQKLFVLNFKNKILDANENNFEILKEKNELIKFLLESLDSDELKIHKELKTYVVYVLSLLNEISNLNDIKENLLKIIKNDYDDLGLEGKIFTLHSFLNLNEKNEKNFEFLKNEFEKILEKNSEKNGLFLNLRSDNNFNLQKIIFKNEFNNLNKKSEQCLNCSTLSFLVDFTKKFKNLDYSNSFNFDLPFVLAKTIIQRDFKINFANPNQLISCLSSFLNYAINFEKQNFSINENEKNNFVDFKISLDSKLSSEEKIFLPNYIEIENLTQFLDKDIVFKIKENENKIEKQNNFSQKNIIYFFMKLDLFEKFELKNLKENKNFNSEHGQFLGIKLKKEYFKYNFENGDFLKIENLENAFFQKGDLIKINLKITSNEEKQFVVLEDIMPNFGIFFDQNMILNEKIFNFETKNEFQKFSPIIQNGNIKFYFENIPSGEKNIFYLIKIDSSGKFNLLPANIKEINNEEIFAWTEGYKNIFVK